MLSLLAILALLSVPTFSQSSDPVTVDLTWQYEGGISLVISETFLDWGLIPLLVDPILIEDWFPCPTVPQIIISFKLPSINHVELVAETPALFTYNGITDKNPSAFMHHEITGGFIVPETPLPNPTDSQVWMWTSAWCTGKVVGDLLFKVWRHQEYGGVESAFTGSVIYTALDIIS